MSEQVSLGSPLRARASFEKSAINSDLRRCFAFMFRTNVWLCRHGAVECPALLHDSTNCLAIAANSFGVIALLSRSGSLSAGILKTLPVERAFSIVLTCLLPE